MLPIRCNSNAKSQKLKFLQINLTGTNYPSKQFDQKKIEENILTVKQYISLIF